MLSETGIGHIRACAYEAVPSALFTCDLLGFIVDLNESAELLFGYPRQALMGQPVDVLLPEELREVHRQHLLPYGDHPYKRPMGLGHVLVGRHKNGQLMPLNIHLSPVVVPEGTFVIVTVHRRAPEPSP